MAEDTQVTIEVPITSEGVMGLKQALQTLKAAYQKSSLAEVGSDENALYPSLLPMIKGIKSDATAGSGAFKSYETMSLDDIPRPETKMGNLSSYKDIDKIAGNYPLSQTTYDEAKTEADKILKSMKASAAPEDSTALGGAFQQSNPIDKVKSGSTDKKTTIKYQGVDYEKTNQSSAKDKRAATLKFNKDNALDKTADAPEQIVGGISALGEIITEKTKGSFRGNIAEQCIPCSLRLVGPDALEVGGQIANIWEGFLEEWKKLKQQIYDLLHNKDIIDDICSLLNFLDFQCVPDLFSLLALLAALIQKYSGDIPNLDGLFNAFLGNFFTPMLGGLSELLDRYIQMIMGPADCVINSLDTQLAKLDVQKGLREFDTEALSTHRKREAYLRNKMEQLQERKATLQKLKSEGVDPDKSPPRKVGGSPRSSQSSILKRTMEGDTADSIRSKSFEFSIPGAKTINEELVVIEKDLAELKKKYKAEYGKDGKNELSKLYKKNVNPSPTVIQNARGGMRDFRQGLYSSLFYVRQEALNARRVIGDTLQVFQDELERILFGRTQTAAEQFESARGIQRIARVIGIIRVLISLKSLVKEGNLCDNTNGDPSVALGSFLTAYKGAEPASNNHKFYKGSDGNTLLVASSDAVLEIVDPETETVTQVDDLDEVEKLNRDGIPKDIGEIANKKVIATSANLGVETPVAIMKLDLCNNSSFSTQPDIDNIMRWAQDAGLN